jgi:hypothetical protein
MAIAKVSFSDEGLQVVGGSSSMSAPAFRLSTRTTWNRYLSLEASPPSNFMPTRYIDATTAEQANVVLSNVWNNHELHFSVYRPSVVRRHPVMILANRSSLPRTPYKVGDKLSSRVLDRLK